MDASSFTPKQKFIMEMADKFEQLANTKNLQQEESIMIDICNTYDKHIKAHDLELLLKITKLINKHQKS